MSLALPDLGWSSFLAAQAAALSGAYVARAEALAPFLTVLAVNVRDPTDLSQILVRCHSDRTGALVGSSSARKTTLMICQTDAGEATVGIREGARNSESVAEARAPDKAFDKMVRAVRRERIGRNKR